MDRSKTVDIRRHNFPSATDDTIDAFHLWVPYAGVDLTIATEGTGTLFQYVSGDGRGIELRQPIEDFAWMGTGLYEVRGEVHTVAGETCRSSFYLRVTGRLRRPRC